MTRGQCEQMLDRAINAGIATADLATRLSRFDGFDVDVAVVRSAQEMLMAVQARLQLRLDVMPESHGERRR